jgi:acyl-CoA reductase-like NAD-dependent aldehyde dehydrogenase
MTATVLDRVTPATRIYSEESFGPVVCAVRRTGVDDVVRIANDTEYGLSAAVFGQDIACALSVAKRINSGMCHINGPTIHDGGKTGVDEFTELRWISIQTMPLHYPF